MTDPLAPYRRKPTTTTEPSKEPAGYVALRNGRDSVEASASGERSSRGQRPLAAGFGDGRKIPKMAKAVELVRLNHLFCVALPSDNRRLWRGELFSACMITLVILKRRHDDLGCLGIPGPRPAPLEPTHRSQSK
jgi:hypothetical protein